jgi:iron complex outermembrane recepter protein
MKKMFLEICLFLTANSIFSQATLKGLVMQKDSQQPVAGATVTLNNTAYETVTNNQGEFVLPKLNTGKNIIVLSSVGYKTTSVEITAGNAALSYTFEMQKYSLFLEPVEVKAIRANANAPFAKTNFTKKEIELNNLGHDLPFIINQTPSVIINADAGNGVGYTGIRIRGTDATRINMTINGIPYNDAESQGLFFVNLPDLASSVNSIQIQRGVGTSGNGAGAFGATLNFSTHEFNENAYAEVNNGYGSFNTWKNTVKAGSGLLNNHFIIDARLSRITSEGYIDRAATTLGSFYLSGAYLGKKSTFRLNIFSGKEKTYQAWNGILQSQLKACRTCNTSGTEKPGEPYDNETDNYQQDHYQFFFNHNLNNNFSLNVATFFTRGKGYYENYKAGELFANYGVQDVTVADTTLSSTDLIRQLWLNNKFYGAIYSLQYKKTATQITFGGGYNRYQGNHYGKVVWSQLGGFDKDYKWYKLNALKTDLNFYAKWQQQLSTGFSSFADVQYRQVQYNIGGFKNNPALKVNNTYNFFNPKAGISYNKNKWNAFASFSVANKEPNRDDFEAGANLQPRHEQLYDAELGVAHSVGNTKLSATVYYMYYRNQLVLTGKINDVGAYTRTNIPKSYRLGVELESNTRLITWLSLQTNLTLSENKVINFTEFIDDYDNGNQKINNFSRSNISFSPWVTGGYTFTITPFQHAAIAIIGKYVGKQFLDNTSNKNRSLSGYYVQDARISYNLSGKKIKQTVFILQLNNVLNKKYEANGYTFSYIYNNQLSTENYVFPMAGFNVMFGVNIKL